MAQGRSERAWTGSVAGGPVDPFGARLARWVADAKVDDAALSRQRGRALAEAADQEATVTGLLLDLAELGAPVAIEAGGSRHLGWVTAVGADFVALSADAGPTVLIAGGAIEVISPAHGSKARGDRVVTADLSLLRVLAELAEEREPIRITTRGGASASGTVVGLGQDVIRVRSAGEPPAQTYVPLDAVASVALI